MTDTLFDTRPVCVVCERQEGTFAGRPGDHSEPGIDAVKLGDLKTCLDCGQWACPDCLHERDCCEIADVMKAEK